LDLALDPSTAFLPEQGAGRLSGTDVHPPAAAFGLPGRERQLFQIHAQYARPIRLHTYVAQPRQQLAGLFGGPARSAPTFAQAAPGVHIELLRTDVNCQAISRHFRRSADLNEPSPEEATGVLLAIYMQEPRFQPFGQSHGKRIFPALAAVPILNPTPGG